MRRISKEATDDEVNVGIGLRSDSMKERLESFLACPYGEIQRRIQSNDGKVAVTLDFLHPERSGVYYIARLKVCCGGQGSLSGMTPAL